MKHNGVLATAILFLLLGTTLPALAQNADDGKGGTAPTSPQSQPQPTRVPQVKYQPQPTRAPTAPRETQPSRAPLGQNQPQPTRAPLSPLPAQPQRSQNMHASTPANHADGDGNQYGGISNVNYTAHFGPGHAFHMLHPQMVSGYNRFQYGGYWFGFNQGWPFDWNYGDPCYVVYQAGAYYLYNLSHPGIHVTLNLF